MTSAEIEAWLVTRVSGLSGQEATEIDAHEPLVRYGLDSIAIVALAADLEKWLGYRFRSNPIDDHPTIAALAQFLEKETRPASRDAADTRGGG